jgi:ATP-dependent Clp protease ATP-binding subunit ClpA
MNFYELKRKKTDVYPAIILESIMNKKQRKTLRKFLYYSMVLAFCLIIVSFLSTTSFFANTSLSEILSPWVFVFRSVFVFLFSVWFTLYLFELMYLSYYFKETDIDFEVLKLVTRSDPKDITASFVNSEVGQYTLLRLGINNNEVKDFLKNRTDFVQETEYEIIENEDNKITFAEFGYSLLHFDSDFSKLLKSYGVTAQDFKETLHWVSRVSKRIRNEERWWTKERLMRIPSIGKSWSFGQIYYLDRFGHSIYTDVSYYHLGDKWRLYSETVNKIENIIAKDVGGNVMITSRESDTGLSIIAALGKEIVNGTVLPELEGKRIYVLDVNMLISTYEDKASFESMFRRILQQANDAGDVILVIPHFSDFVENSASYETDVKDVLSEAMSSTRIHIVAISNTKGFHEVLETDLDMMRNFEKITMEDLSEEEALEFAQDEAQIIESEKEIIFTYQSLKSVVESAGRYFNESSMSDKTLDILNEVANSAISKNKVLITADDVAQIVEDKTGVPLGVLSKKEKSKLSQIEMLLKQRVIGQDKAIQTISEAMKRARLGVANPKRPLGSFLFIGPTGVGKTETSKALAENFFGDDEDMIRIDMSEFNDGGSIERLIGDRNNAGILSSKIRDNQYGVLLLDEFEKGHPDVHNLFLQILDEGFFSDGNGEKVNARNLIIIATSNAGSDLMYKAIDKEINLQGIKDKVIGYLIDQKLFRPEFINRFDDVVLFNALTDSNLESIAHIMIQKLNTRLESKGLEVKASDDFVSYLVSKGNNQKFGAREINRVIQKDVETKIADALIQDKIFSGDTIVFENSGDDISITRQQ